MWSGPRNISTAMMRSWGARPDTFVCDEPLYAHYLERTGLDHPGAAEVIAHHETDVDRVVAWLTGPVPGGRAIFYQKHMAHHVLPGMATGWVDGLTNCFLIREPREMITSLMKVIPDPGASQTGLPQQVSLFDRVVATTGVVPPVIDSKDVLSDPRGMLRSLCASIGVPFLESMLSWAPGSRETDGIWACHWYAAVERSTGFEPYRPKADAVPSRLGGVLAECEELYARLHAHRLAAPAA